MVFLAFEEGHYGVEGVGVKSQNWSLGRQNVKQLAVRLRGDFHNERVRVSEGVQRLFLGQALWKLGQQSYYFVTLSLHEVQLLHCFGKRVVVLEPCILTFTPSILKVRIVLGLVRSCVNHHEGIAAFGKLVGRS